MPPVLLTLALLSSLAAANSSSANDAGESSEDATLLLEAAQVLPPLPTVIPNVSDMGTLETAARVVLTAHDKIIGVVPADVAGRGALSQLMVSRQDAVAAAAKLREAFGQPTTSMNLKAMAGLVDALVKADRALSAELRTLIDKLQPTAVVVSGGVSLGSYQAGLLHYYSQYLLQHRIAVSQLSKKLAEEPMVATGASAGSVNAFLAAVATCRRPVTRPQDSFFWKVWMPIGFDGLVNLEDVTTYSMLSRTPLDEAVRVVAADWNDGNWQTEPCRLNIGMTVTREIPRSVPLNTNAGDEAAQVRLPIQTERVIFTLEGNGSVSPSVRSVVPESREQGSGERSDFYVDWGIATKEGDPFPIAAARILQASAAFPIAWPPVMLKMNGASSHAYFLDGGLFDNNPVRLATRLLDWSGPGQKKVKIAQTRLRTRSLSRLLYVEPDATTWQTELQEEVDRRSSFSSMYGQLTMSLIGTARRAELLSTMEYDESDTLKDRIDVPLRRWPITGAFMLNFFAFLEEDFRRFDFYSGMADAAEFLSGRSGVQRMGLQNVVVDSAEFECVMAFRRAEGETRAKDHWACKYLLMRPGDDEVSKHHSRNLLALLDTSAEVRTSIFACIAAKNCQVGAEFNTLSSALPKNGFVFSDANLQGSSVIGAVRDRLQPIISEFARLQPFPESAALAIGGKAALDSFSVRPSRWYFGVGMLSRSGAEVEFSSRVGPAWRPVTFGLRVLRLQPRFLVALRNVAEERDSGTLEAYWHPLSVEGGFAWVTPKWPWWLRFGLSAGIGAETTTLGFVPAVYRFPASASVTATLFQRAYLRFSLKQYVLDKCPNTPCGIFSEDYAADAVQLAGIRADWAVSVGWRWID